MAYPQYDDSSPVLLSLVFKHNQSCATATLLLQSSLLIDGFDIKQAFILQYDADNLVSGQTYLSPVAIRLPQQQLIELAREGCPRMSTLCLTLKKACPIWSSSSPGLLTPQSEHEVSFHRLANIAKATRVCILFDHNWLHSDHHVIFQRLVEQPNQLSGFPVGRYYSKQTCRRVDNWSAFESGDTQDADAYATTEDEAEEAPPGYGEGSKRPRCGGAYCEQVADR